jgi:hypothetical protein
MNGPDTGETDAFLQSVMQRALKPMPNETQAMAARLAEAIHDAERLEAEHNLWQCFTGVMVRTATVVRQSVSLSPAVWNADILGLRS